MFGLGWSGLMTAGEWALTDARIQWGWPLAAALLFVAVGPAVLAYRCWGLGVQQAGPTVAGFFGNLTPVFAAVMSARVGKDVKVKIAVDETLIGGLVVKLGSTMIDTSIKSKLAALQNAMKEVG